MGLFVLHKVHWNVLLQEPFECFASGIVAMRGGEQTTGDERHADQAQQHHQTVCEKEINKIQVKFT